MTRFDLEERLINFSVAIIELTKEMPSNAAGRHLSSQILRSGTSVALNYGEAQSGESRKDFIHKMKLVLNQRSLCRQIQSSALIFAEHAQRITKSEIMVHFGILQSISLMPRTIIDLRISDQNFDSH